MPMAYEKFVKTADGVGPPQDIREGMPLQFLTLQVQSLYLSITFHQGTDGDGFLPGHIILLTRNTAGAKFVFNASVSHVSFKYFIAKSVPESKSLEAIFFDVAGKEVGRVTRNSQPESHTGTIESPASATKLASVQIISYGNSNAVNEFAMTL
jgi:hypothetical protein